MSVALANALAAEGLDVHFAGAVGPLRRNLDPRVTFHALDNPNVFPLRVAHTLSLLLREIRPDIIHSHGALCAMVAAAARNASKVPSVRVLTHHSRVFRRAPGWLAARIMARTADHYVAISKDKQEDMVAHGIPREKTSLIPNLVDVARVAERVAAVDTAQTRRSLQIPEDAVVLMMAGRVIDTKRFDVFVKIAAETARRSSSRAVHALVVGDGPELERVRRLARDQGGAIHFLGFQSDIIPSLAISDAVVFPSEHPEVLPMFLIEASAAGKAIVCSDLPGNREIVTDGETGRVVHGDVDAYAAAVTEIVADAALAQRLGAAARANALQHFDQKHVALATIAMYRSLLAAREPKG